MFSSFGLRAVQVGRQNIPVVLTPTMKMPSKDESLLTNARCMVFLSGSFEAVIGAPWVEFWGSIRQGGGWALPENGHAIILPEDFSEHPSFFYGIATFANQC